MGFHGISWEILLDGGFPRFSAPAPAGCSSTVLPASAVVKSVTCESPPLECGKLAEQSVEVTRRLGPELTGIEQARVGDHRRLAAPDAAADDQPVGADGAAAVERAGRDRQH